MVSPIALSSPPSISASSSFKPSDRISDIELMSAKISQRDNLLIPLKQLFFMV